MKSTSVTLSKERLEFSFYLIAEQLLGRYFHLLFGTSKAKLLQKIAERLNSQAQVQKAEVPRISGLTSAEFKKSYFQTSTPVVFSGAALEWPAIKKWSFDNLALRSGSEDVLIVTADGLTDRNTETDFEILTLAELIADIRKGGKKYLRFSPLMDKNPELKNELNLSWLQNMQGDRTFAHASYMFVGGIGQKTLLHTDQPCNLYVQIVGEKKWTLFSPDDSALLYPQVGNTAYIKSPVDVDEADHIRFPLFKHARSFEVVLKPGDVLYVPPHTWHFVENLTDTIAVGYRYSSLRAALKSSVTLTMLRIFSTNPPIWKTMSYGKIDTNLIWAHAGGKISQVMKAMEERIK